MVIRFKKIHIVALFSFSWMLFNKVAPMDSINDLEDLPGQETPSPFLDTSESETPTASIADSPDASSTSTTFTNSSAEGYSSRSPFSKEDSEEEGDREEYAELQRNMAALRGHATQAFHVHFLNSFDRSALKKASALSLKISEEQRKTAQAIREITSPLIKATADLPALLNFTKEILRTNSRLLRILNHLYDESGNPDVGAWREIVYRIKKRRQGLGLHADYDLLYTLRDTYTPEFIAQNRSTHPAGAGGFSSSHPFAHLSKEEINLFLKIRDGILTGFERGTDTISAADLEMARVLRVDPANGEATAYFTSSWIEQINGIEEKIREFITLPPRPHPLNGEFLPEYRFTFKRAAPTATFAAQFFIEVLQTHCHPLQLVKYSPARETPQVIIRGKVKGHPNQWWHIKLLGFPKSVARSAPRENNGRGFYLGWINPNVAHIAINLEVKETTDPTNLMPSPASMKPLANGHLLIAFPSRENIRQAIELLKAATTEEVPLPSVAILSPPATPPKTKERKLQPFTGEKAIRKLLEKIERLTSVASEAVEKWKSADPSAETKQKEAEELINKLTQTYATFLAELSTLASEELPAFWERLQTTVNPLLESPKLQEAIRAARPKGFR